MPAAEKTPPNSLLATEWDRLLDGVRDLAEGPIARSANAADQADQPPAANIALLAEGGLLGMTVPTEYGGLGAPAEVVRAYQEMLSAACGLTTFVQGQHLSACSLILGSENDDLKREMLPQMASGSLMSGVAFSHLRRQGAPAVRAEPLACGDFLVTGVAPWFTGWPITQHVVLGATLPDGRLLYAAIPVVESATLHVSEPMKLAAMNASGTVTLHFSEHRIAAGAVMKTISQDQMADNDANAVLNVTPQPLGLITACIRLLQQLGSDRGSADVCDLADCLLAEQQAVRSAVDRWRGRSTEPEYIEKALAVRAACLELAVRSAHGVVAASGGLANSREHSAQRLFREAMFYNLTAQTRAVQSATLQRLVATSRRAIA